MPEIARHGACAGNRGIILLCRKRARRAFGPVGGFVWERRVQPVAGNKTARRRDGTVSIMPHTAALLAKIVGCVKPPPKMTISQWADGYRKLSESSAEPGQWKTSKAPYQRAIMDAISDPAVRKVVVMSAAQIGKTDAFLLNPIGYYMDYAPAPIMVMQPTIQLGESFSKDRLAPMIRDTPALAGKVSNKSRASGNTILHKIFPGGHVTIVGANSAASLAQRPIKILLADEIDRYPATAGNEGDPLMLAGKRQTTFWDKKEVDVSTPTIKDLSRIEVEYLHSTMEEWCLPCPNCGKYQPLAWAQVSYDKNAPEDVGYTCEYCGCVENEYKWKAQSKQGKYIAEHPESKVRGFHLNTLASLFCPWAEIVDKYEKAKTEMEKGNPELMKTFVNTELGQTWEEKGEQIEDSTLYTRRETYKAEVPDDVLVLTAGIDTQDDRFEIEVVGWCEEKESYGIIYKKIFGDLLQPYIWEELDAFLKQTWKKADGTELPILATCMDSGGHYTDEVLRFCKARYYRRIFAIKGRGGADVAYINNPTKNNRVKAPLFILGVDTGKSVLYQRLKVAVPGPNYCHFPKNPDAGYDERYFKGLTAEKMIIRYVKGKSSFQWVLKDTAFRRNEPLDIRNYATAALEIARPTLKKPETDEKGARKTTARRGRRKISGGI